MVLSVAKGQGRVFGGKHSSFFSSLVFQYNIIRWIVGHFHGVRGARLIAVPDNYVPNPRTTKEIYSYVEPWAAGRGDSSFEKRFITVAVFACEMRRVYFVPIYNLYYYYYSVSCSCILCCAVVHSTASTIRAVLLL